MPYCWIVLWTIVLGNVYAISCPYPFSAALTGFHYRDVRKNENKVRQDRAFNQFDVYAHGSRLIFHPTHGQSCLDVTAAGIESTSVTVQRIPSLSNRIPAGRFLVRCDGIFGFYRLPLGNYIAVITKSSDVNDIDIPGIRKVECVKLVKLPRQSCTDTKQSKPLVQSIRSLAASTSVSNGLQREDQEKSERLLLRTIREHTFYFSTGPYDISRSLQANSLRSVSRAKECNDSSELTEGGHVIDTLPVQAKLRQPKSRGRRPQQLHEQVQKGEREEVRSLMVEDENNQEAQESARHALYPSDWRFADERFFWNIHSVLPLLEAGLEEFVTPVVNAWIGTTQFTFEGNLYRFSLISRRSRRRQGPRSVVYAFCFVLPFSE